MLIFKSSNPINGLGIHWKNYHGSAALWVGMLSVVGVGKSQLRWFGHLAATLWRFSGRTQLRGDPGNASENPAYPADCGAAGDKSWVSGFSPMLFITFLWCFLKKELSVAGPDSYPQTGASFLEQRKAGTASTTISHLKTASLTLLLTVYGLLTQHLSSHRLRFDIIDI